MIVGLHNFWPWTLGMSKALEVMFSSDMVDAVEAKRIGLVSRIVPHDKSMIVVKELTGKLATGSSVAIELMKKLITSYLTMT